MAQPNVGIILMMCVGYGFLRGLTIAVMASREDARWEFTRSRARQVGALERLLRVPLGVSMGISLLLSTLR
jgi:hypothetical protein